MKEKFYFTPECAAEELWHRQKDQELIAHVEEWRKAENLTLPSLTQSKPSAYFARQIATCRYEDIVFQSIVRSMGLTPVWIEFIQDRFVTVSPYKRSLVHRCYCAGRGRKGGWKITKRNGIDMRQYDGKPMSEIRMSNGESLIAYHHALQDKYLDHPVRQDLSSWLTSFGDSHAYYESFLAIFLVHGVLVEDYHVENYHNGAASSSDLDFARNVFEPAWHKIVNGVGIKPLIVPLPWVDGMQYFPQDGHRQHCVIDCDDIFRSIVR